MVTTDARTVALKITGKSGPPKIIVFYEHASRFSKDMCMLSADTHNHLQLFDVVTCVGQKTTLLSVSVILLRVWVTACDSDTYKSSAWRGENNFILLQTNFKPFNHATLS